MLNKIVNFILLLFLLIKLLSKLVLFSIQYLLLKVKEKQELTPLLLVVLLMLCLINWKLWQKHMHPAVELKAALSQNPGEILLALEQTELAELKKFYSSLATQQQYNRDVLFNLGKILELEDLSLAQEKFDQAWELDPNYSQPETNYSN
jgi:predicted negative regulator of RcsB-dependent stress response